MIAVKKREIGKHFTPFFRTVVVSGNLKRDGKLLVRCEGLILQHPIFMTGQHTKAEVAYILTDLLNAYFEGTYRVGFLDRPQLLKDGVAIFALSKKGKEK